MAEYEYTVGMAGHIDHGKTSLTKALTNIDTDRLKEEKERNISIELGFAPLLLSDNLRVSIIDVPGHERFIRQMIAGVAGIDLVILVVAGDEGVMPQTKEHLEILSFLGIERGIIAVSKLDRVDEEMLELVEEDIKSEVEGTIFAESPLVFVDSISGRGIDQLKKEIEHQLATVPKRNAKGAFRLPIDQVFTVHGQGTVVRGTVYEGSVYEGDQLEIVPAGHKVRARQIQVHHEQKKEGKAGQRVAINLGGIAKDQVKRGDALVSSKHYTSTNTIDVSLDTVQILDYPLKQRSLVKVHIGTAEVLGTIVFFDRNELLEQETILCQIRLQHPVITKRGDRFIVRRPTPAETIGGGIVIDAIGERYRFGEETIAMLKRKKEGTPLDRVIDELKDHKLISIESIVKETLLPIDVVKEVISELNESGMLIETDNEQLMLKDEYHTIVESITEELKEYHNLFPLREGKNKAEVIQSLSTTIPKRAIEFVVDYASKSSKQINKDGQFLYTAEFQPHYPEKWAKRMEQIESDLKKQGITVEPWEDIVSRSQIPDPLTEELKHYLIRKELVYPLSDKLVVHRQALAESKEQLAIKTSTSFSLQEAKDALQLSRKYLVPFLELLDSLAITEREGTNRTWKNRS